MESSVSNEEKKIEELLIPLEDYLAAGLRIGTHLKNKFMKRFIYSIRQDTQGQELYLLDIRKTDERIRIAAKFIAQYDPSKVIVVSGRQYGRKPVLKFCALTNTIPIVGRFLPGTFTNPSLKHYKEAELVLISDPRIDSQALKESAAMGIPVIALCDTDNVPSYVDLIIPANNRGRKALALLFWLLARQVLRERGEIPPHGDLPVSVEEFETKI